MSGVDRFHGPLFSGAGPDVAVQRERLPRGIIPFRLIGAVAVAADLIVILGCALASTVLYHDLILDRPAPIDAFVTLGVFVFANFAAIQAGRGNYQPQQLFEARKQIHAVSVIWLLTFVFVLAAAFSFKLTQTYSRAATLTFFVSGWVCLVAVRIALSRFLHGMLSRSAFAKRQVLVITDRSQHNASTIVRNLERCGYSSLKSIEINLDDDSTSRGVTRSLPAASLNEIIEISRNTDINSIFLEVPWSKRRAIEEIMSQLRVLSMPVYLLPDSNVAHFLNHQVVPIGMDWSAELKRAPLSPLEQFGKRCIDMMLSSIVLVLLAPVLALVCLAIKLDSRGPIFFLQTRHGFNGKPFQDFQVSHHDGVRLRGTGPAGHARRSAHHAGRPNAAADQPRRASAVVQRDQGRHGAGRSAAARGVTQHRIREADRQLCIPLSHAAGHHRLGPGPGAARRDQNARPHGRACRGRSLVRQ